MSQQHQSSEVVYALEIQAKYEELFQKLDTVNDQTTRKEKEKLYHSCLTYATDLDDFKIATLGERIEEKLKTVKGRDFVKVVKKKKKELEKYNQPQEAQNQPTRPTYRAEIVEHTEECPNELVEQIDTSKFKPLTPKELIEILGLTIKHDEENKIVTFLCELSAYTENAQFNISYNAPSSTGKSYIPIEIARLFPEKDVIELGHCSPTAFFHDVGEYNKELKGYIVDLSHKILIFLDQPHNELLARLRPMLSHDKKEISLKITDKNQKFGLRTKNVLLRGYPSVIFCTAGLKIDEQEATRFLLLSPEINQEKIRQGISEIIKKEADNDSYKEWLEENPDRKLLKERIQAIKAENVREIKIANREEVQRRFLRQNNILKPRHQRDIKRLISLIKALALLNLWWREKDGLTITASEEDIEYAFEIWGKISVSQELNLPPYVYKLYQEVILPAWYEKNGCRNDGFVEATGTLGLSRQEILSMHFKVYGRMLDVSQLRKEILPMLETAGLITQEPDPNDKRNKLVYPTVLSPISKEEKYRGNEGGVQNEKKDKSEYPTPESPISQNQRNNVIEGGVNGTKEPCIKCGNPVSRRTYGRDSNGKWGVNCFCDGCTI